MNKILVLLFSFGVANIGLCENFKIAGKYLSFTKHASGLLIQNCSEKCEALKVLDIAKYKVSSIVPKRETASSYGSDACSYLLGGKSILGRASNGDGRDFCLFKDDSLVEMYSLTVYLEKNKILKE